MDGLRKGFSEWLRLEQLVKPFFDLAQVLAEGLRKEPLLAAPVLITIVGVFFCFIAGIVLALVASPLFALILLGIPLTALPFWILYPKMLDRLASHPTSPLAPKGGQRPNDLFTLGTGEEKRVLSYLEGVTRNVSLLLNIDISYLRSNIFAPDQQRMLRIVGGLHYNMMGEEELRVEIPIGYGCSGYSFAEKKPIIAIFKQDWGRYSLSPKETAKLDRNLKWIVSTPIPDPSTEGKILGILNVDCLHQSKTERELERIIPDLVYWAGLIGSVIF